MSNLVKAARIGSARMSPGPATLRCDGETAEGRKVLHKLTAELAYQKWEAAGCPDGSDREHWHAAEGEIRQIIAGIDEEAEPWVTLMRMPAEQVIETLRALLVEGERFCGLRIFQPNPDQDAQGKNSRTERAMGDII